MRRPSPSSAAGAAIFLTMSLSACAAMLDRLERPRTPATEQVACPALTTAPTPTWAAASTTLPPFEVPAVPASLEARVAVWERIWGRLGDRQHLLVDGDRPWIVWAEVDCRGVGDTACKARLDEARDHAVARFSAFAQTGSDDELLARYDGDADLAGGAEERLITLRGRRGFLRSGLRRAAGELHEVEAIFAAADVPRAFARIALFESGWQSDGVSHKGAAGIFQFTPSTAQHLLTVDDVVDERLDTRRSAAAAARYLKDLRDQLGSWPLALTAYNTGPTRLTTVMTARGSRDLGVVVNGGDHGGFGFDGQNYAAQIIAIARVSAETPLAVSHRNDALYEVVGDTSIPAIAACLDVDVDALAAANPALTAIADGSGSVPVGHIVQVPGRDDGSRFAQQ